MGVLGSEFGVLGLSGGVEHNTAFLVSSHPGPPHRNPEPGTRTRTWNPEPGPGRLGTRNPTRDPEPGTRDPEPGTGGPDPFVQKNDIPGLRA